MRKRRWKQWMAGFLALAMLVTETPIVQAEEGVTSVAEETVAEQITATSLEATTLEGTVGSLIDVPGGSQMEISYYLEAGYYKIANPDGCTITLTDDMGGQINTEDGWYLVAGGTHTLYVDATGVSNTTIAIDEPTTATLGTFNLNVIEGQVDYYQIIPSVTGRYRIYTTEESEPCYGYLKDETGNVLADDVFFNFSATLQAGKKYFLALEGCYDDEWSAAEIAIEKSPEFVSCNIEALPNVTTVIQGLLDSSTKDGLDLEGLQFVLVDEYGQNYSYTYDHELDDYERDVWYSDDQNNPINLSQFTYAGPAIRHSNFMGYDLEIPFTIDPVEEWVPEREYSLNGEPRYFHYCLEETSTIEYNLTNAETYRLECYDGLGNRIEAYEMQADDYYYALLTEDSSSSSQDMSFSFKVTPLESETPEEEKYVVDAAVIGKYNPLFYLDLEESYGPTDLTIELTYSDGSAEQVVYDTSRWNELESDVYYTDANGNMVDVISSPGEYQRNFCLAGQRVSISFTAYKVYADEIDGALDTAYEVCRNTTADIIYEVPEGFYRVSAPLNLAVALKKENGNNISSDLRTWVYLQAGKYTLSVENQTENDENVSLISVPEVEEGRFAAVIGEEIYTEYFKFVPETSGTYYIYSVGDNDTYGYFIDEPNGSYLESDDDGAGTNFRFALDLEAGKAYFIGTRFYGPEPGTINVVIEKVRNYVSYEIITEPFETSIEAGDGYYQPDGMIVRLIDDSGDGITLTYGTDEWYLAETGYDFFDEKWNHVNLSSYQSYGKVIRRSYLYDTFLDVPFTVTPIALGVPGQEYVLEPGKTLRFHWNAEENTKIVYAFTNAEDVHVSSHNPYGYGPGEVESGYVFGEDMYFEVVCNGKTDDSKDSTFSFRITTAEESAFTGELGASYTLQPDFNTTITYEIAESGFYKLLYSGANGVATMYNNYDNWYSPLQSGWEFYRAGTYTVEISTLAENEACTLTFAVPEYQTVEAGRHTVLADDCAFLKFVPATTGYYNFYSETAFDTYGYLADATGDYLQNNDGGMEMNFRIMKWMEAGSEYYLGARFADNHTASMDVVIEAETGIVGCVQVGGFYANYNILDGGEYEPVGLTLEVIYGDGSTQYMTYGTPEWDALESNVYYTDGYGNSVELEDIGTGYYSRCFEFAGNYVSIGFTAAPVYKEQGIVGTGYTVEEGTILNITYNLSAGYYSIRHEEGIPLTFHSVRGNVIELITSDGRDWMYLDEGTYELNLDSVYFSGLEASLLGCRDIEEGRTEVNITEGGSAVFFRFVPTVSGRFDIYSVGSDDTYGYFAAENTGLEADDDSYGDGQFLFGRDLEAGKTYYIGVKFYSQSMTGPIQLVIERHYSFVSYAISTEPSVTAIEAGEGEYIPEGLVISLIAEDGYKKPFVYGSEEWNEEEYSVWYSDEYNNSINLSKLSWTGNAIRHSEIKGISLEVPFTVNPIADIVPEQQYSLETGKVLRLHFAPEDSSKLEFTFTNADDYTVEVYDFWGMYYGCYQSGDALGAGNYYFLVTLNTKADGEEAAAFSFRQTVPEKVEFDGVIGETYTLQPNTVTTIRFDVPTTGFYKPLYDGTRIDLHVSGWGGSYSTGFNQWDILYRGSIELTITSWWDEEEHSFSLIPAEYPAVTEGTSTVYADNYAFMKFVPEVSSYYNFYSSNAKHDAGAYIMYNGGFNTTDGYKEENDFRMQYWMEAGETYYLVVFYGSEDADDMEVTIECETGIVAYYIIDSYNSFYQWDSGVDFEPIGMQCVMTYGDGSTVTVVCGTPEWDELVNDVYYTDASGNEISLAEIEKGAYYKYFRIGNLLFGAYFIAADLNIIQGTVGETYTTNTKTYNVITYHVSNGYYRVINPGNCIFNVKNNDNFISVYNNSTWLRLTEGTLTMEFDATYEQTGITVGLQAATDVEVGSFVAEITEVDGLEYFRFVPAVSSRYDIYSTGDVNTLAYLHTGDVYQYSSSDGETENFRFNEPLTAGQEYFIGVGFEDGTVGSMDVVIQMAYNYSEAEGELGETYLLGYEEQLVLAYNISETGYYHIEVPYQWACTVYDAEHNEISADGMFNYKLVPGIYYVSVINDYYGDFYVRMNGAEKVSEGRKQLYAEGYGQYYYSFTPETSGRYMLYSEGMGDFLLRYYENGHECMIDNGGESMNFCGTRYMEAGETYLFCFQNCGYWDEDAVFGIERLKEIKSSELVNSTMPWKIGYQNSITYSDLMLKVTYEDDSTEEIPNSYVGALKWFVLVTDSYLSCENGTRVDDAEEVWDESGWLLPGNYVFHAFVGDADNTITLTVTEPIVLEVGKKAAVDEESVNTLRLKIEKAGIYRVTGPENVVVSVGLSYHDRLFDTEYYCLEAGVYTPYISLSQYDENSYVMLQEAETVGVGATSLLVNAGETKVVTFIPDSFGDYVIYSANDGEDTYGYLRGSDVYADSDDDGDGSNFWMSRYLKAGEVYAIGCRFYAGDEEGAIELRIEANRTITDCYLTDPGFVDQACLGDYQYRPEGRRIVTVVYSDGAEESVNYNDYAWCVHEENVRILSAEGTEFQTWDYINFLPCGRYYRACELYGHEIRVPFDIVEPTDISEGEYELSLQPGEKAMYTFRAEESGDYDWFFTVSEVTNLRTWLHSYDNGGNTLYPGTDDAHAYQIYLNQGEELRFNVLNESETDADDIKFTIARRKDVKALELVDEGKEWRFYREGYFDFVGLKFKVTFEDDTTEILTSRTDAWNLYINNMGVYRPDGTLTDDSDYEEVYDGMDYLSYLYAGEYLYRFTSGNCVIDVPVTCIDWADLDEFLPGEMIDLPGGRSEIKKLVITEPGWYVFGSDSADNDVEIRVYEPGIGGGAVDKAFSRNEWMPGVETYYLNSGIYKLAFFNRSVQETKVTIKKPDELPVNQTVEIPGCEYQNFVYTITPERDVKYIFHTTGDWDPQIAIYRRDIYGNIYTMFSADNSYDEGFNINEKVALQAGESYYVAVLSRYGNNAGSHTLTVTELPRVAGVRTEEPVQQYPDEYHGSMFDDCVFILEFEDGSELHVSAYSAEYYEYFDSLYTDYDADHNQVEFYDINEIGEYCRHYIVDENEFEVPFAILDYPAIETEERVNVKVGKYYTFRLQVETPGAYRLELPSDISANYRIDGIGQVISGSEYYYLTAQEYRFTICMSGYFDGLSESYFKFVPASAIGIGEHDLNVGTGEIGVVTFIPEVTGTYNIYSTSTGYSDTFGYLASKYFLTSNDDGNGNGNFRMNCRLEAGQTYVIGYKFYYGTTSGTIHLVVEKQKELTAYEILEEPATKVYYAPFANVGNLNLNGLRIKKYYDDGTEEIGEITSGNMSSYIDGYHVADGGNIYHSGWERLPVGTYTCVLCAQNGVHTGFEFEVREVENEVAVNERFYVEGVNVTSYFKIVIDDVTASYRAIGNGPYDFNLRAQDGSYVWLNPNSEPGIYYLEICPHVEDFLVQYVKFDELEEVEIVPYDLDMNRLFKWNSISGNENAFLIRYTTKSGYSTQDNLLSFMNFWSDIYPHTLSVVDSEGKEYSTYKKLNVGTYTLKMSFTNFDMEATTEIEVKDNVDYIPMRKGLKYSVGPSVRYNCFSLDVPMDTQLVFYTDRYATILVYDIEKDQYYSFTGGALVPFHAGKYILNVTSSTANNTIHFEQISALKEVKEVSGASTIIPYGTWGYNRLSVSGNMYYGGQITSRAPANTVINEIPMGYVSGNNVPVKKPAYTTISGNNRPATGTAGSGTGSSVSGNNSISGNNAVKPSVSANNVPAVTKPVIPYVSSNYRKPNKSNSIYAYANVYHDISGNTWSVSGNTVGGYYNPMRPQMGYDWEFETVDDAGEIKNFSFNDALWKLYDFVTKMFFNADGTPAKTDANGFLAPGNYKVEVGNDDASTMIDVQVTLPENAIYVKQQPVDTKAYVGTEATFSIDVLGNNLTYQWEYLDVTDTAWQQATGDGAKSPVLKVAVGDNTALDGRLYRCIVINGLVGQIISDEVLLYVEQKPLLVIRQPESISVQVGKTASFIVETDGTDVEYQWQFRNAGSPNWISSGIKAAKTANMSFAVGTDSTINGREYRCVMKDKTTGMTATSEAATLTVLPAGPTITTQPVDITACAGDSVTFSVKAEGEGLTYQWQFANAGSPNWINSGIKAAKTANMTFVVGTDSTINGRQYRCIVTDADGNSATTDAATLTVEAPGPSITTQPVDISVADGKSVTFSVAAEGEGLAYQWQFRNAGATTWSNSGIKAAKTANMTFVASESIDGREYRCVITDANKKSVISDIVKLTVLTGPVIAAQPEDTTACAGDSVTFSVKAEGEGLTYQWQFANAGSPNWINSGIKAAKTANMSFVVGTDSTLNGRQYRCIVTDVNGNSTITDAATLTVEEAGPEIITQPADITAKNEETVTFSVKAEGEGLTYQWQFKNAGSETWINSGIRAAKTANMTFVASDTISGREYRCVVTDVNKRSVISDAATLTVLTGPAIITQPADIVAAAGQTVTFSVKAEGEGLTYQWQYMNVGSTTWINSGVKAAKTANMTFTASESISGRQYRCIVTDADNQSTTTNAAILTVGEVGPVIIKQPTNITAAAGERITFSVAATGEELTYQWSFRNAGATTWTKSGIAAAKTANMTFVVGTDKTLNGREYRCVVTDKDGKTVSSATAVLTVK